MCVNSSAEISGDESAARPGGQWVEQASAEDEASQEQEYYEGDQDFFIDQDVGVEQPTEVSGDVNIEPSEIVQLDGTGGFESRYTEPAADGFCTVDTSGVAQEQFFAIDDSAREDGSAGVGVHAEIEGAYPADNAMVKNTELASGGDGDAWNMQNYNRYAEQQEDGYGQEKEEDLAYLMEDEGMDDGGVYEEEYAEEEEVGDEEGYGDDDGNW